MTVKPAPAAHAADTGAKAQAAMSRTGFDIERFIRERQPRWQALDRLLQEFAEHDPRTLGRAAVIELVRLYRIVCSDLNQARSYTANPELLDRLNQLVGRSYRIVYQAAPGAIRGGSIWRFLTYDVPATFQAEIRLVLLAAAIFIAGALVGLAAVIIDPANGEILIPAEFFTESPADRVAHIEAEPERLASAEDVAALGSMLYTHNIQVSFLTFSAAALTLVGGWCLLFFNGLILGAVGGLYIIGGVGTFFIAWVGPHGALELPAIIFSAAAGLRLGQALLTPGEFGRADAVRRAFPAVYRIMATAALVLVAAGMIEGSFSQLSAKAVPYAIKIAAAAFLFCCLISWLFLLRRSQADRADPARGSGRPSRATNTERVAA
jgi:uncharacterized membrane protein SpoIIM required for sporulation